MKFEDFLRYIEIGGNIVGFRCNFNHGLRKILQIGWLIYVFCTLGFVGFIGLHMVLNNLSNIEYTISTFGMSSHAVAVIIRVLILLKHRKAFESLVKTLISITEKGGFRRKRTKKVEFKLFTFQLVSSIPALLNKVKQSATSFLNIFLNLFWSQSFQYYSKMSR